MSTLSDSEIKAFWDWFILAEKEIGKNFTYCGAVKRLDYKNLLPKSNPVDVLGPHLRELIET